MVTRCDFKTVVMEFKEFNINESVKVKLTEYGYQKLADFHNQFEGAYPSFKRMTIKKLKKRADKDGYTTFQLWSLMEKLGNHMGMCKQNCFDTTILIKQ